MALVIADLLKSGAQTLLNPWSSADHAVISVPDSRCPVPPSMFPVLHSPFSVHRSPFLAPSEFLVLRFSLPVLRSLLE